MCVCLSKALPEFPAVAGEDKPLTFKRVLLNTCQEEFEGAARARADLDGISDAPQREAAERKVKLRTQGNIRLIGELYKAKMIVERILHSCIGELLGKPKSEPPEENVEALINLLVTVGKELDASPKSTAFMEAYFARLSQLAASKKLPSRLRFLCRDTIELRKAAWVPRREKLQAKKLDVLRADAAHALGLAKPADESLFPEGPNGPPPDDGWSVAGKKKPQQPGGGAGDSPTAGYSALTGQYVPRAEAKARPAAGAEAPETAAGEPARAASGAAAAAPPAAAAAAAAAPTSVPSGGRKPAPRLSEAEVEEQIGKLFAEYQVGTDVGEALLCVRDIQARAPDAGGATARVCARAVELVIGESSERLAEAAAKLLAHLASTGAAPVTAVEAALAAQLGSLEDTALDVPMAPKLMGILVAGLLCASQLPPPYLRTSAELVGDMFCRRDFVVATLVAVEAVGKPPVTQLVASVGSPLASFLVDADADAPSLAKEFAAKKLPASLLADP